MKRLIAILVAVLCLPNDCFAWGPEGHRVVATVARERLSRTTLRHIRELLDNDDLAVISTWADEIREQRPETSGWHFVDIPWDAEGFSAARDCYRPASKYPSSRQDRHNCVVDRIVSFREILANRNATKSDRVEALKFLVHFVADVHQPLHALGRDRGGNEVRVWTLDPQECGNRACNLHALWDVGLIHYATWHSHPPMRAGDFVSVVDHVIAAAHLEARAGGTPQQWANESFRLAHRVWLDNEAKVPHSYYEENIRIMEEQLGVAALRLAAILNETLGR